MDNNDDKALIKTTFDQLRDGFDRSKSALLAADDDYDARGPELEAKIITYAKEFLEPEKNRAKEIRGAAESTIANVRSFTTTRTNLIAKIPIAQLALNVKVLGAASTFLDESVQRVRNGEDLGESGRLKLEAIRAGETVAKMQELVAVLLELRTETMRKFLDENVEINFDVIVEAIKKVAEEEGYKGIFMGVARLMRIPIEEFAPFLKVAKVATRIREEVLKLRQPVGGRGSSDYILELASALREQDLFFKECLAGMQESLDMLSE